MDATVRNIFDDPGSLLPRNPYEHMKAWSAADSDPEPRTQLEKAAWETASVSSTARILPTDPYANVSGASARWTGDGNTTHGIDDNQRTRRPLTRRFRSAASSVKDTVTNALNQPLPVRFGI